MQACTPTGRRSQKRRARPSPICPAIGNYRAAIWLAKAEQIPTSTEFGASPNGPVPTTTTRSLPLPLAIPRAAPRHRPDDGPQDREAKSMLHSINDNASSRLGANVSSSPLLIAG